MSFGAATTVIAGGEEPRVRAVWEDSSYADMDEAIRDYLAHEGYPSILAPGGELAARIVAGDDLTSKSPLAEMPAYAGRPLAIVHGEADTLLSPRYAEELRDAAEAAGVDLREYWTVPGVEHTRAVIDERAGLRAAPDRLLHGRPRRAVAVGRDGDPGRAPAPRILGRVTPETARPASQPVHAVEVRWDVRIPVRDGLELSANLWLPVAAEDARDARFPVILEMIPYGKDNWRRNADVAHGEWLAARGFAFCRLDVRGTGSSPGVALDEYTEAETLDGYDAVEWLAAQPWCNGNVGMWGISYGGFTSIQVAKLRPPHLRAILPMYATDDRYRDDVHVRGGCITASEKSQYAVSQLGMNAMPPLPAFRGDAWRDEWRERLEQTPPWLFAWIREQTDGPYWRRGSLAPEYEALECAVFQVAGWSDSYVDPAFRIQERCTTPRGGPSSATGFTRSPTTPTRARTSTGGTRPSGSSTAISRRRERLGARARADLVRARVGATGAVPDGLAGPLAGRRGVSGARHGPARARPRRGRADRRGHPPRRAVRGVIRRQADRRAMGPAPASGDRWDLRRAVVGRRMAAERPGPGPRPDEQRGLTFTSRATRRSRSPSSGRPEVVLFLQPTMPVATCVVRLSEVSPDGVSSSSPRASSTSPIGCRMPSHPRCRQRSASGVHEVRIPAADERLPVRSRQPGPADRPDLVLAGAVAVAVCPASCGCPTGAS